tara:strand:+ start:25939 stop:26583 length:645 start_codon:yes stop_codon:yes gene_type:complete
MKNLFLAVALMLSIGAVAQEENTRIDFYLGFDVPNAIRGGKLVNGEPRNNNALDIKGGWTLTDGRVSFGTYLEYFEAIDYFSAGMKLGSPSRINDAFSWIRIDWLGIDLSNWETDIVITPSVQTEWVWRDGLPEEVIPENVTIKESLNWGVSLDIQFDQLFNDSPLYAEFGFGMKYRQDKYNIWGRDVDPSGTLPALWENREFYFTVGYEIFKR